MMSKEEPLVGNKLKSPRQRSKLHLADLLLLAGMILIPVVWVASRTEGEPLMPEKIADEEERDLYLVPGGVYSAADIDANDKMTASEKYSGYRAKHDYHPKPGDRICPITRTKADPRCHWIINEEQYAFCCPPCIDEFLQLAKQSPEAIQPAVDYVK